MSSFVLASDPTEDYDIEIGNAPAPEDPVAKAAELNAERERLARENEELKQRQAAAGQIDTLGQIVAKQQEQEALRRQEELARQQASQSQGFGLRDDDPRWDELEAAFLESPKKALAKMAKMIQQDMVVPMGQYLAGQVESVRSETERQQLLSDDINRETYKRYQAEVDAEVKRLGGTRGAAQTALEIVRGRHLTDMAAYLAEKNKPAEEPAAAAAGAQPGAKPAAANRNPGQQGVPPAQGQERQKAKLYVPPELMAGKPRGMTVEAWTEYLIGEGKLKR